MKLMKNTILPAAAILLLAYLGKCIYMVDGGIDWLRFCLVFGIPFGIPYMLFVIPIGGNPAGSATILILNLIVGAAFGCVIAMFAAIRATGYFVWWILSSVRKLAWRLYRR